MRNLIMITFMCLTVILTSGCSSNSEVSKLKEQNADLQQQLSDLQKENEDLKNQVSMYVPKAPTQKTAEGSNNQPVELSSINIGPDNIGITGVDVSFKNTSQKNIDGIEFVVLKFDNFGKPSERDNVSSILTMQGNAATGGNLSSGWTMYADNKKARKAKVVVKQVHFTDGAVWENKSFEDDVAKEKIKYE